MDVRAYFNSPSVNLTPLEPVRVAGKSSGFHTGNSGRYDGFGTSNSIVPLGKVAEKRTDL
jgi:hypothetical protein